MRYNFLDDSEETSGRAFIENNMFSIFGDSKRQGREMFNIIFGLIMLVGGLSGEMVLIGTQSSDALTILGAIILAVGIYQMLKKQD